MCCCNSSAERGTRRAAQRRGFTLVELLVAQVIVAVVVAGVFALLAAQTRTYHSNWSATESQVRLREATHVVLRELQGIGGETGLSGDVVLFTDGGTSASDTLTIFMRDFSLCGGVFNAVHVGGSVNIDLDTSQDLSTPADGTPDCPIGTLPGCSAAALMGRDLFIRGQNHSVSLQVTNVDTGSCRLQFNSGVENDPMVGIYNARWGTTHSSVPQILNDVDPVNAIVFGSTMTFLVDDTNEVLMRSVNGAPAVKVLPRVTDLQVAFAHDLNGNRRIDVGEWDETGTLAGATPANFYGVRFGFVTYAQAGDQQAETLPQLGNRTMFGPNDNRRYRHSRHFAATRNR